MSGNAPDVAVKLLVMAVAGLLALIGVIWFAVSYFF